MFDLQREIIFWLGLIAARAAETGRQEHDRDENSAHKTISGAGHQRHGRIRGNTRNSRRLPWLVPVKRKIEPVAEFARNPRHYALSLGILANSAIRRFLG